MISALGLEEAEGPVSASLHLMSISASFKQNVNPPVGSSIKRWRSSSETEGGMRYSEAEDGTSGERVAAAVDVEAGSVDAAGRVRVTVTLGREAEAAGAVGGPPSAMGGPPRAVAGPPSAVGGPASAVGGPPSAVGGPPNAVATEEEEEEPKAGAKTLPGRKGAVVDEQDVAATAGGVRLTATLDRDAVTGSVDLGGVDAVGVDHGDVDHDGMNTGWW